MPGHKVLSAAGKLIRMETALLSQLSQSQKRWLVYGISLWILDLTDTYNQLGIDDMKVEGKLAGGMKGLMGGR